MKGLFPGRFLKRKGSVWFITAVILLAAPVAATISCHNPGIVDEEARSTGERIADAKTGVIDYYRQNKSEPGTWWEAVALRGAGEDPGGENLSFAAPVEEEMDNNIPATVHAGIVLGLLAIGEDPFGQLQTLLEMQEDGGGFGGGLNNTVWSIIALNCASAMGFDGEKQEMAVQYLLNHQMEDGGFAYSGNKGDPDMTAMAIHALSSCQTVPGAEEGIKKALGFLKEKQLPGGGFSSFGQENANSVAMVISGLIAAGEDPFDPAWAGTGGVSLPEILLSYRLEDGSFSFLPGSAASDSMATVQALVALGDLTAGETVFNRLARGER